MVFLVVVVFLIIIQESFFEVFEFSVLFFVYKFFVDILVGVMIIFIMIIGFVIYYKNEMDSVLICIK